MNHEFAIFTKTFCTEVYFSQKFEIGVSPEQLHTNLRKGSKPTLWKVSLTYIFCWINNRYISFPCIQSLLTPIFEKPGNFERLFVFRSKWKLLSFQNDSLFFKLRSMLQLLHEGWEVFSWHLISVRQHP